jgi:alginate O-acetyltransferase complex protein AlgJ
MSTPPAHTPNDRRVAQAHAEVGRTAVSRSVALVLTGMFVVATASVSLTQLWLEPQVWHVGSGGTGVVGHAPPADTLVAQVVTRNRRLLEIIATVTDQLDNESLLARHLRPVVQLLITRLAGAGNERVYIGRNGWLFFANDIQHVVGPGFLDEAQLARRAASGNTLTAAPQPDPRPALLAFNDALAERGITLVLMPTPVKPAIHPEQLTSRAAGAPLRNLSFDQFRDEMQAAGVLLFDPAPVLAATRAITVSDQGDTLDLLGLPAGWSPSATDTVTTRQVTTPDGELWQPSRRAEVLLLGDSFSNIYSVESMGWGRGAGLAEHLSLALARPIDRVAQNDNGAFATRAALARDLTRNPDRLAATRVVVYQFAARELSQGDWRLVDLETASRSASGAVSPDQGLAATVLSPTPGRALTVRGRIRQRAPAPRPGTVPYRDHIIAVELVDITGDDPTLDESMALVYLSSMEDNVWTPAATLATGAVVTLFLRPWDEVAPEREGITRGELVEGDVIFARPWWGELVTP